MKFKSIHDTKRDLKEIPLFLYGNDKVNLRNYLPYYLYMKLMSLFVWGNEIVLSEKALNITKSSNKRFRDRRDKGGNCDFQYFGPINSIKIKRSYCFA